VFTTDAWKDPQKYIPPRNFYILLRLSALVTFFFLFPSCPTAPAHRLYPTVSVSPPSSARTHRPLSTTPPGCSSSRSGSGLASPPSSRPPKSLPRSVPLISFLSTSRFRFHLQLFLHLPFTSSPSPAPCPIIFGEVWVWCCLIACLPLYVCLREQLCSQAVAMLL